MDATFGKDGDRYVLVVERRLAHPPEKVWRVLTERELLKQWFPCDVEGEWEVGEKLRFTFLHGGGEEWSEEDMRGEVLAVDPPRLLEYRWGSSLVRCELSPEGDGCRFALSETQDDPSMGARNAAGWEMCLENLDAVLSGISVAKFAWDAWHGKFDRYVKKFEPEFGPQQGPPESFTGVEDEESG